MAERHLELPEHAFHLSKADLLCLLHDYWDGRGASALARDRAGCSQHQSVGRGVDSQDTGLAPTLTVLGSVVGNEDCPYVCWHL